MGQRKLANLRKLVDQARTFDQSGVMGLADFIVQLSQFVVEQPREPLAATNPEGTDVVRLMTIHQAKGLEFPVVFVADIGRQVQHRDNAAVWHPELGPLVKVSRRGEKGAAISGLDLHQATSAAEDRAERFGCSTWQLPARPTIWCFPAAFLIPISNRLRPRGSSCWPNVSICAPAGVVQRCLVTMRFKFRKSK